MYLNGKRVRAAAKLRTLTREQVQEQSGIATEDFDYYWTNDATTPSQSHVDALAKTLAVNAATLLWSGQPKHVALRPDKFTTPSVSNIEWDTSKAHIRYFASKPKRPQKGKP